MNSSKLNCLVFVICWEFEFLKSVGFLNSYNIESLVVYRWFFVENEFIFKGIEYEYILNCVL